MPVLLQGLAVLLALVAAVFALIAHQRSGGARSVVWGTRASFLLSLSIMVGIVPGLLFPSVAWVRWGGTLLSLFLTTGSLILMRRQWRVVHS